jgi:hypothetical protein
MGRTGRPIYQYNLKGELTNTFPMAKDALKDLHINPKSFRDIVDRNGVIEGHIYSWSSEGVTPATVRQDKDSEPWEDNGYFNIAMWGAAFKY